MTKSAIKSSVQWSLIILMTLLGTSFASGQQFDDDEFGMNRVQYRQFKWRYVTTENFEIYYYDDGYRLARLAAMYAEEEIGHIVNLVGYSPYGKTKIFIYKNITDLQQSNIGVNEQGVEVGGQTQFVRSEIEVAYPGNKYKFRGELVQSIADIFIFEMMYGGNLKELLKNSYLLNLPEWFMAGAARYVAYGWDKEMDDYVRDVLYNTKFKKLSKLTGEEAEIIGQSIWHYIAAEYGEDHFSNILNFTRIVRDERQAIYTTLKVRFKVFIEGWKKFHMQHVDKIIDDHVNPGLDEVFDKNSKNMILNMTKLSSDGRYIAWTENYRGRYKVLVEDLYSGKQKTVLKGGYRVINQKMNEEIPLISWKSNHELAMISTKNGRNFAWFYDLEKKIKSRKRVGLRNFNNINSFDINDQGTQMVLSAELQGRSDLYLYHIKRRSFQFLMSDEFDDIDPSFLPNGYQIAFSSNRDSDSLVVSKGQVDLDHLPEDRFNLFLYDLRNPDVLHRVTNTVSFDRAPVALTDSTLIFVSDQRGIDHLYLAEINSGFNKQLTNYRQNIKDYDFKAGRLAMIMLFEGRDQLFKSDALDVTKSQFTPKTRWKQIKDLIFLQDLKRKRQLAQAAAKLDSAKANVKDSVASKPTDVATTRNKVWKNSDEIDTDNWPFDQTNLRQDQKKTSFLDRYTSNKKQTGLVLDEDVIKTRSQFYQRQMVMDNILTGFVWDPLRGGGMTMQSEATDVLENHKIDLGLTMFSVNGPFEHSNYYIEYEYLKKRIDFRFRHERRRLILDITPLDLHSYTLNLFQGEASYPFSVTSRFSLSPFLGMTRFTNIFSSTNLISVPDQTRGYAGTKAKFVYDNSIVTGMNMRSGTRFKASFDSYYGIEGGVKTFHNFALDLRHYQRIHRSVTLATRFGFGKFFGPGRQKYMLGGTEDMLFTSYPNNFSQSLERLAGPGTASELDFTDLLFYQYAAPMRGFDFAHQAGANYLMMNLELRFPLAKYFYRGTVTSNFLRNLQLIGFYDMGSSWTGGTPFTSENDINTTEVNSPPWSATVTTFRNPFIMSYGAGARTTLVGFYLKADVSWPIENNIVRQKPRLQVSIGHDF